MTIVWAIFLAIIGAACGSFVGALTYRLKKGGKAWREFWLMKGKYSRSVCEKCGHQLGVPDLIPIVSWLALRGKCRYCHAKIGGSALWLEIGVGAAFVMSYLLWPADWGILAISKFVVWLVAIILMAALLVYDARWRTLPNKLMWPLIGVAVIFAILSINYANIWGSILAILLALIPVFGVYLLLYAVSRGTWVGLGDVKFGLVVALLLADWRLALAVLAGANVLGSLFVLPQLITKRLHANSQIAFGPWLIVATFLAFLFAQPILNFIAKYILWS